MNPSQQILRCDGCGQAATTEHTARRLRRLEWTTRFRPVHIHALLLGAISPADERHFLYSPSVDFESEAGLLPRALGISLAGKTIDGVQAEIQRAGILLTYVLECPIETERKSESEATALITERLPSVAALVRRSFRPKRVILVTAELAPMTKTILRLELGCPVVTDAGKPFALHGVAGRNAAERLRDALELKSHD